MPETDLIKCFNMLSGTLPLSLVPLFDIFVHLSISMQHAFALDIAQFTDKPKLRNYYTMKFVHKTQT